METRPGLVSISILSAWSLMVTLRLPNILSQDTAAVSFLCLGRQPRLFIAMPTLPGLSIHDDWFFVFSSAWCHCPAHKFPLPSQCLLDHPKENTTNTCLSFFFFPPIRLMVLNSACALKALKKFFKPSF